MGIGSERSRDDSNLAVFYFATFLVAIIEYKNGY